MALVNYTSNYNKGKCIINGLHNSPSLCKKNLVNKSLYVTTKTHDNCNSIGYALLKHGDLGCKTCLH